MHEMSIMATILDKIGEITQRENGARVTHIELAIGERAGVVTDALTFAFEAMSPDTIASGAELVITEIPLCYRCPSCAMETAESLNLCPACDVFLEAVRGRELQITFIEIE